MKLLLAILLLFGPCVQPPRVRVHADHLSAGSRAGIAATTQQALESAEETLGIRISRPVQLHIAREAEELPLPLRTSFQDWTIAVALRGEATVWILAKRLSPDAPNDLRTVLEHELVHVLLGELESDLGDGTRRIPRWLHEGLAQHVAGSIYLDGDEQLVWFRAATDRLLGWGRLADSFPRDREESRVAYAQSASFIAFLERRIGLDTVVVTIRDYLAGTAQNLDAALSKTEWSTSYAALTGKWLEELKGGRGLFVFLWSNCFQFLIVLAIPLLGIVLYKRFRREKRAGERLEEWERAEAMAREGREDQ